MQRAYAKVNSSSAGQGTGRSSNSSGSSGRGDSKRSNSFGRGNGGRGNGGRGFAKANTFANLGNDADNSDEEDSAKPSSFEGNVDNSRANERVEAVTENVFERPSIGRTTINSRAIALTGEVDTSSIEEPTSWRNPPSQKDDGFIFQSHRNKKAGGGHKGPYTAAPPGVNRQSDAREFNGGYKSGDKRQSGGNGYNNSHGHQNNKSGSAGGERKYDKSGSKTGSGGGSGAQDAKNAVQSMLKASIKGAVLNKDMLAKLVVDHINNICPVFLGKIDYKSEKLTKFMQIIISYALHQIVNPDFEKGCEVKSNFDFIANVLINMRDAYGYPAIHYLFWSCAIKRPVEGFIIQPSDIRQFFLMLLKIGYLMSDANKKGETTYQSMHSAFLAGVLHPDAFRELHEIITNPPEYVIAGSAHDIVQKVAPESDFDKVRNRILWIMTVAMDEFVIKLILSLCMYTKGNNSVGEGSASDSINNHLSFYIRCLKEGPLYVKDKSDLCIFFEKIHDIDTKEWDPEDMTEMFKQTLIDIATRMELKTFRNGEIIDWIEQPTSGENIKTTWDVIVIDDTNIKFQHLKATNIATLVGLFGDSDDIDEYLLHAIENWQHKLEKVFIPCGIAAWKRGHELSPVVASKLQDLLSDRSITISLKLRHDLEPLTGVSFSVTESSTSKSSRVSKEHLHGVKIAQSIYGSLALTREDDLVEEIPDSKPTEIDPDDNWFNDHAFDTCEFTGPLKELAGCNSQIVRCGTSRKFVSIRFVSPEDNTTRLNSLVVEIEDRLAAKDINVEDICMSIVAASLCSGVLTIVNTILRIFVEDGFIDRELFEKASCDVFNNFEDLIKMYPKSSYTIRDAVAGGFSDLKINDIMRAVSFLQDSPDGGIGCQFVKPTAGNLPVMKFSFNKAIDKTCNEKLKNFANELENFLKENDHDVVGAYELVITAALCKLDNPADMGAFTTMIRYFIQIELMNETCYDAARNTVLSGIDSVIADYPAYYSCIKLAKDLII